MTRALPRIPWRSLALAVTTAVLVVGAAAPSAAAANRLTLLKDINPGGSSFPTYLTKVGSTLFFAANDGVHGTELWKTDGTAAGTKMVKDIRRYSKGSSPADLVNVNGELFFTAADGVHGRQLWKSDGTKAGTVMVAATGTSPAAQPSCGGAIGTTSGYLDSGMYYPPVAVGNRLFYFVSGGGCACCSVTLYVSDGTAAGTYALDVVEVSTDIEEGGHNAAALNGKLYFVGSDDWDGTTGIWVSDGTLSGTHALAGSPTGYMSFLPAQGQSLYFATYTEDVWPAQIQLWKTDGTELGTKPLTSVGELSDVPTEAAYMAKRLYFLGSYRDPATDYSYDQLWRTDGTARGTKPIATLGMYAQPSGLTRSGSRLFFVVDRDLWKSDGTATGTKDVGQFGAQYPRDLIAVGDKLCFAEMDWNAGTWSLWESNGSASGTYQLGTFAGNPDSLVQVAIGSKLIFAANDISHGMELWSYTP